MSTVRTIRDELVLLPARAQRDQAEVNCCLSCAIGACLEAMLPTSPVLSALYHFHFAGGTSSVRTGIQESAAKAALLSRGICRLGLHPFTITTPNVSLVPDSVAVHDGQGRRPIDRDTGELICEPVPLSNSQLQWRSRLRSGIPLVAIIAPNPSYRNDVATTGHLGDASGPLESILHAVAVIGYSDAEDSFLIQDSRGNSFGPLGGQWWLPYNLARTPFLVSAMCFANLT